MPCYQFCHPQYCPILLLQWRCREIKLPHPNIQWKWLTVYMLTWHTVNTVHVDLDIYSNCILLNYYFVSHLEECSNEVHLHFSVFFFPSVSKPPFQSNTPEDWAQWSWHRLQTQPWVLGGAVVLAVFFVVFLAMIIFAFAFGCCCSRSGAGQPRKARNDVLWHANSVKFVNKRGTKEKKNPTVPAVCVWF